jgi:PhnB protein
MIKQSIYLFFDGNAKEALEFYQLCLGGKLQLTPVGSSFMKNILPLSFHDKILNGSLLSERVDISVSDWLRPEETPVRGNMSCLYVSGGTAEETKNLFDKLSAGGNVTDPLKIEPFGTYGALNDQFGVRWMFHAD